MAMYDYYYYNADKEEVHNVIKSIVEGESSVEIKEDGTFSISYYGFDNSHFDSVNITEGQVFDDAVVAYRHITNPLNIALDRDNVSEEEYIYIQTKD